MADLASPVTALECWDTLYIPADNRSAAEVVCELPEDHDGDHRSQFCVGDTLTTVTWKHHGRKSP